MSNIAVISLAGSQHLVIPGDKLEVNRLKSEVGKDLTHDVLLSTKGDTLLLNEGDVKVKVIEHKLGDKLHIVKFKAKSRYRRRIGHRQHLSVVEVISINGDTKSLQKVEDKPLKEETKAVTKTTKKVTTKKEVKSVKKGKK